MPELAAEVRTLISEGKDTGRTVIETFTVDDQGERRRQRRLCDRAVAPHVRLPEHGRSGLERSARLTAAVTALTSFPVLVLTRSSISLVFASSASIFLIALALG